MFGERQSQLAFIPKIIRAVLNDEFVDVHRHNGKIGERSYTYVRNVTDRVVDELAGDDRTGTHDARYVVLPGQRRVANDVLVQQVAQLLGREPRVNVVEATDVRPGYDPTYVDLVADWVPKISFDDGLERTVRGKLTT
jgi:nucleoside-diphosphate-sugar epimerase